MRNERKPVPKPKGPTNPPKYVNHKVKPAQTKTLETPPKKPIPQVEKPHTKEPPTKPENPPKQDDKSRHKLYEFISKLEYDLLDLPKPDNVIFLHMPYEQACILKAKRNESADEVEKNENYLRNGEKAYIELAKQNNWITVSCVKDNIIRSIDDINDEVYIRVKEIIENE